MYAPPEAARPLCIARIENRAMLLAAAELALAEAGEQEVGGISMGTPRTDADMDPK